MNPNKCGNDICLVIVGVYSIKTRIQWRNLIKLTFSEYFHFHATLYFFSTTLVKGLGDKASQYTIFIFIL